MQLAPLSIQACVLQLAASHISYLKTLPTNSMDCVVEVYATVIRTPPMFWGEVLHAFG
jgi:hypothetical protein